MKIGMLTSSLLLFVLSSVAQLPLKRKDVYGTWELSAINAVVLKELEKELRQPSMHAVYIEFKKKKRYSLTREAVTTTGRFEIERSAKGTNTLLLTDENGEHHGFVVTNEKKSGEYLLVFTENEQPDGSTGEAENVSGFIKIKDRDLKEFRKKVEQEKKLLPEKEK